MQKNIPTSHKRAPDLNNYTNLGAARVFFQQKEEIAHVPFDGREEIEVESIDEVKFLRNSVLGFWIHFARNLDFYWGDFSR